MAHLREILFRTPTVSVGAFRCDPTDEQFGQLARVRGHVIVFPRRSVHIMQAGCQRLFADPLISVFYNRHQEYCREAVAGQGDYSDFYEFSSESVASCVGRYEPSAIDRLDAPFSVNFGWSDARCYALQRHVFNVVSERRTPIDSLWVEECMLHVLECCVDAAFQRRGIALKKMSLKTRHAHEQRVRATREVIDQGFGQRLTLTDIARQVHTSEFHLSRMFRAKTGYSIHQYLLQRRLRAGLNAISEGADDLTRLALDLGFSSHSHFTNAFRRAFGAPPSSYRELPAVLRN